MRFQNCSSPAHQRFQVLRPLTSSGDRLVPPSIGAKTSAAISGKSSGLRPPASSTSVGVEQAAPIRLVATTTAKHASSERVVFIINPRLEVYSSFPRERSAARILQSHSLSAAAVQSFY